MIPRIIHYIWLGPKPIPDLVAENSKVIGPEWEVKVWTDKDFTFNECEWVRQAKALNLLMYCSDALRFYILNKYGGVYLDCDVRLHHTPDNLLSLPYCIGNEEYFDYSPNSGILLSEPGNSVINMFWEMYAKTPLVKNGQYVQDNDTDRLRNYLQNRKKTMVSSIKEYKEHVKDSFCIFEYDGWETFNPKKDYSFAEHLHHFSWGDLSKGWGTTVKVNIE